jgi:hypothetical protein
MRRNAHQIGRVASRQEASLRVGDKVAALDDLARQAEFSDIE